jgi:hypothetical protein
VTVVDRPTISGSGRFMITFAVPSALGHAAARAPPRLRRLLRPIGKANNLNEKEKKGANRGQKCLESIT